MRLGSASMDAGSSPALAIPSAGALLQARSTLRGLCAALQIRFGASLAPAAFIEVKNNRTFFYKSVKIHSGTDSTGKLVILPSGRIISIAPTAIGMSLRIVTYPVSGGVDPFRPSARNPQGKRSVTN